MEHAWTLFEVLFPLLFCGGHSVRCSDPLVVRHRPYDFLGILVNQLLNEESQL